MKTYLIVLDSFGIGNAPDAKDFGDFGANTLKSCYETGILHIPNMIKLGLGNINGIDYLPKCPKPVGQYGRLIELSKGKDTITGHWEIAGIISDKPMPTFPNGFPDEFIEQFKKATGKDVLCNKPYSGTEVIKDYGEQALKRKALIVYTSADSVFQIAAHENVISNEELYEYCKIARKLLTGDYAVGRVIARPFAGKVGNFYRTSGRHDFSLEPTNTTLLDNMQKVGFDTIGVGKIHDIFAGKGLDQFSFSDSNKDGMKKTEKYAKTDFNGLCFVNLVDFDMLYGHRRDAYGYAKAINEFDKWLGKFMCEIHGDDMIIITADHGCDPNFKGTDHTRECVPLLIYNRNDSGYNLDDIYGYSYITDYIEQIYGI